MKRFDPGLIAATLLLASFGLLAIYSSGGSYFFFRQLIFLAAAIGAAAAAVFIPRRILYGLAEPIYGLAVLMLIAVLIAGTGPGSHRWFVLGPVYVQPSEFAKLTTVLLLAKHLSYKRTIGLSFRDLALPAAIAAVPSLLVMVEPDLSTSLIFAAMLAAMLYWQGMRPLHILLLFSPALSFAAGFSLYTWIPFFVVMGIILLFRAGVRNALVGLGVSAGFGLLSPVVLASLKGYQRARIMSFFAPWFDPHGISWNAIQSQIAIGSGRLIGKGLFQGSQKRLGFLPNRHTDFVFSSLGEELGLVGCLVLLGLFFWLVRRILLAARQSGDSTGSLLCVGFAAIIGYQMFVNIGMLLGMLPITGITLPFVSYGGSSLLLNFLMVGLVLNVISRPE
ncbi:rod shape-determining protein RodA [candidate division WOR-3 bacterium]|uniref:Rod shape-determining protein RodA n=1 Tax=candidate division WOR-3 bacterium TaxID=2052148 RepID=A0A938BTY5_UNCW3|nr:rod shape-determining protein RodA [candidate division WOR-3 bacterium]